MRFVLFYVYPLFLDVPYEVKKNVVCAGYIHLSAI